MHGLLLVCYVVLCSITVFTLAVKLIIATIDNMISAAKLKITQPECATDACTLDKHRQPNHF